MPHRENVTIPPTILVVADGLTHRSIVARMVRTLGFQVRSAQNSHVALRYLREHPGEVKVLLTDVALRRMDGYELVDRARELDPSLRVVVMVTLAGSQADELIDQIAFVAKPVHLGELAGVLYREAGTPPSSPSEQAVLRPRRRSSGRRWR